MAADDEALRTYAPPPRAHADCDGNPSTRVLRSEDLPVVPAGPAPGAPRRSTAVGMCGAHPPYDGLFPGQGPIFTCILDAGHAGWHRDEAGGQWTPGADEPSVGLTAEQEIRARAALIAGGVFANAGDPDGPDVRRVGENLLWLADQIAAWINTGNPTITEKES